MRGDADGIAANADVDALGGEAVGEGRGEPAGQGEADHVAHAVVLGGDDEAQCSRRIGDPRRESADVARHAVHTPGEDLLERRASPWGAG